MLFEEIALHLRGNVGIDGSVQLRDPLCLFGYVLLERFCNFDIRRLRPGLVFLFSATHRACPKRQSKNKHAMEPSRRERNECRGRSTRDSSMSRNQKSGLHGSLEVDWTTIAY